MNIEAKREYIVIDARMSKCDVCKKLYAKLFELTPSKKNNAFDSILLCKECLDKCQLEYNINIGELKEIGSVTAWQKMKE